MCGIAGYADLSNRPIEDNSVIRRMASMLVHRGPDDEGLLVDGPVAFGFRRLSIIDLATGHQPVRNETGSVWVMLNGEIYNYVELRKDLAARGHVFETESDTEVIAHAYESFGLDFVEKLRGMFAIALWDREAGRLVLARDRVGKKPLFYSQRNGQLAFASELKGLLPWPHLDREIDAAGLHDYLTFLYVPAPASIFASVKKLPPAHLLVADCRTGAVNVSRYWKLTPAPDRSKPLAWYAERLRETLHEAVRIRLRSDVPLGVLLSGGVDSAAVAGLAAREAPGLRSFSIGFPDPRFDETEHARMAASGFGLDHTVETVDWNTLTPDELMKLLWYMDEPFADSSAIPTYWVSRLARKHVTVALSGDGGDELFAGYTRYEHFQVLRRLGMLPRAVRLAAMHSAGGLLKLTGPSERLRQAQKLFRLSALEDDEQILHLMTYFDEAGKHALYSPAWRTEVNGYSSYEQVQRQMRNVPLEGEPLSRLMARDIETNMVDDALVKVDRASMACSLEVRCPLLDHHVLELAMRVPPEYKIGGGRRKIVLTEALKDVLPRSIVERRKQGFEVPFAAWFQREPWRSLLVDTLSEESIRRQGIFDPANVVALRDAFLDDPEARHQRVSAYQLRHHVWMLFVFQIWHERFMAAPEKL